MASLEEIDDEERTCEGLAAICKNAPRQTFAIWWEMCHSKQEAATLYADQKRVDAQEKIAAEEQGEEGEMTEKKKKKKKKQAKGH
jgi:23S rRNA A2030 N6-methylase RlmJ